MQLLDQIQKVEMRYNNMERQLSDPSVISDSNKFREISKQHSELAEIVACAREYRDELKTIAETELMLGNEKDTEMRKLIREELDAAKLKSNQLEENIKILMIPKDPNDSKNAYLEIRQGTGGEEAALFAANLFEMYKRYCETHRFQLEILSFSPAEAGGLKEVIALVSGSNVFSQLKYESGTHRVQRVPKTEASGRVHTSAATVAIIPEQEEVILEINPSDLRIDTFRASGAGGQHINKTDSAVRITHIPSGFVVACQEARSQHRNKELAMRLLKSRLFEHLQEKQRKAEAADRKSQVGSGDRSEKIRTYNYPQNRVTDHRIGLTLYNLEEIVKGDLEEIISALQAADRVEKLSKQEQQQG
jgi:peptide chain release factor 1